MNGRIFLMIFLIGKPIVAKKRIWIGWIGLVFTPKCTFTKARKKTRINFRDRFCKYFLQQLYALLSAMQSSAVCTVCASICRQRCCVKSRNSHHRLAFEPKRIILRIRNGISNRIRTAVQAEIVFLLFHIDNLLKVCYCLFVRQTPLTYTASSNKNYRNRRFIRPHRCAILGAVRHLFYFIYYHIHFFLKSVIIKAIHDNVHFIVTFALRLLLHNLRFRKTEIDAEIAFEGFADPADTLQDSAVRFETQAVGDLLQRTLFQT